MESGLTAFEVTQGGSGQCFNVVSDLKRNWLEVKRHLLPDTAARQFPEKENIVGVSNVQTSNTMEERTAASSSLGYFSNPMSRFLGFCCDKGLVACAQLNRYLYPELLERAGTERDDEPPASRWH